MHLWGYKVIAWTPSQSSVTRLLSHSVDNHSVPILTQTISSPLKATKKEKKRDRRWRVRSVRSKFKGSYSDYWVRSCASEDESNGSRTRPSSTWLRCYSSYACFVNSLTCGWTVWPDRIQLVCIKYCQVAGRWTGRFGVELMWRTVDSFDSFNHLSRIFWCGGCECVCVLHLQDDWIHYRVVFVPYSLTVSVPVNNIVTIPNRI